MPIRPPALDDRRYDDLVAELVARIPAHTPEWTNPRVGDPGRTLIDLFAWLGDALLYRANLIPERQRLAFLRLVGQPLRPARPARGFVTLSLKPNERAALALRPPIRFPQPVPFEARHELTVLPLTLAAFYKQQVGLEEIEPELADALAVVHNQGAGIRPYRVTPLFVDGQPVPEGFDAFGTPADRCVWLGLFAPKAHDQANANRDVLESLKAVPDGGPPLLSFGFVPAFPRAEVLPTTSGTVQSRAPHLWEITVNTTGRAIDEDHPWQPEYLALERVADTTRGLTQAGVVRLALPPAALLHAPANDVRADTNAGVGDRPPRLDDTELAQRLLAWIRLRPMPPGTPGAVGASTQEVEHLWVSWLGLNALEVEQLVTRENLIIGESNGAADQEFPLPATSVEPETLRLTVEGDTLATDWQRVDDLLALDRDAAASRDARVFQLDPEAGTVRFGDGVRGRLPATGRRIIIRQMRSGGGAEGNLPAGSLTTVTAVSLDGQVVSDKLVVAQPMPFTGGEDAETLQDAERRIPSLFRHRERAVAADDYRTLARETPGVRVGRAEVLPRFKPQQRLTEVPGLVTVLALPEATLSPAPNPRADRPFLEAVYAWLDPRRPLGTELYVIGCEYVPVAVTVAISLREEAEPTTTEQAVKDALRRVLWPLPGGGFDGQGWPLGRAVSNRELAVEVARVAGVSEVAGLNLFERESNSGMWKPLAGADSVQEQTQTLELWQLPELLGITVAVGESRAPLAFTAAPNPFADPRAVAVPVVPKLC